MSLCALWARSSRAASPPRVRLAGQVAQRSALGIGSSADDLRTGWYPNQPALAPASVSASDFGQLFQTQLDGSMYAQPLLANGALLVATETNHLYTLDPMNGAAIANRQLEGPWNAADLGCRDLVPEDGHHRDAGHRHPRPGNVTAYFITKSYPSGHLRARGGLDARGGHPHARRADRLPGADPGDGRQPAERRLQRHATSSSAPGS